MRILLLISMIALLFSCEKKRIDPLAFPAVKLDNYEFENYSEPEIEIPVTYSNGLQQTLLQLTSVDQLTGESYTIYGLYIGDTATIDQDTVIYYAHGQSRHMDYYWTRAALLANLGGKMNYGVFMIDYRGYGMSDGTSSEIGLSEDVNSGLDWLISKGLTQDRAIFYGFSLGAIPMIERVAHRLDFQPEKLICESPLASAEYLTQQSTLLNVPASFLTDLKFNNAEVIKEVNVPYMWIHGIEDDYVSIDNGELIYSNYSGPYKEAHRIDGAGHGDVPVVFGLENYLAVVLEFVRK